MFPDSYLFCYTMVRAFGRQNTIQKSRSFNLKRMFEIPGRQIQSLIFENGHDGGVVEEKIITNSFDVKRVASPLEPQHIGWSLNHDMGPVSRLEIGVPAKVGSPHTKPNSGKIIFIHITCMHFKLHQFYLNLIIPEQ